MPSVRRVYQGQNNKFVQRLGTTVPQATPRIPMLFTQTMLKARLHNPSASITGTIGLCLLSPRRIPAVIVFAAQNKSVMDKTDSTRPESSAYCHPIQRLMKLLPRSMKVTAIG